MKIVVLGSCRYTPYEILIVPKKIPDKWNTSEGYFEASKIFYPAIDISDVVWVYAPEGVGKHTQLDIDYAISKGKAVLFLTPIPIRTNVALRKL